MAKRKPMNLNIKKGALHKQMGIKQGKPIPTGKLERLKAHGSPLEKKRANFALVARKWHHGGGKPKMPRVKAEGE